MNQKRLVQEIWFIYAPAHTPDLHPSPQRRWRNIEVTNYMVYTRSFVSTHRHDPYPALQRWSRNMCLELCVCVHYAPTHTRSWFDAATLVTIYVRPPACVYITVTHTSELNPMPRGGHKYTYIYKWYIFIHSGYRCISRRYIYV